LKQSEKIICGANSDEGKVQTAEVPMSLEDFSPQRAQRDKAATKKVNHKMHKNHKSRMAERMHVKNLFCVPCEFCGSKNVHKKQEVGG